MTTHDGKSRKAKTRKTKSTKGTKGEITQILQTHSGDHAGNRTRVATICSARPSRLHRDAAASRGDCRRNRKRTHDLSGLRFSQSFSVNPGIRAERAGNLVSSLIYTGPTSS